MTNIGPNGASVLAGALSHPQCKLTDLDVSRNGINVEDITDIATALRHSKQLANLNLANNIIGSGGAASLADALPHSGVTKLNLCGNNINDEGAIALTDALLHPQSKLAKLLLDDEGIGDEGAIAIANLLFRKLIRLELSKTGIGDDGIITIAEAPQEQGATVTELLLWGNEIGDEGAEAIADALPESPVTHLDLSENNIDEQGIRAIANTVVRSKISRLNLTHNCMSRAACMALVKAQKNEPGIGNRALVHTIDEHLASHMD